MARHDKGSSFFVATASSKPWTDILSLGETIVRELGLNESNDILGRWMAHRLAEHIHNAEKARTKQARLAAESAATDLVLKIWEHRSHWPKGWPPETAAAVIKRLEPARWEWEALSQRETSGSRWLDVLHVLDVIHEAEKWYFEAAGLAELDFSSEQAALSRAKELSPEEQECLQGLLKLRTKAFQDLGLDLSDGGPPPRNRVRKSALAHLTRIAEARSALVEEVTAPKRRRSQRTSKAANGNSVAARVGGAATIAGRGQRAEPVKTPEPGTTREN